MHGSLGVEKCRLEERVRLVAAIEGAPQGSESVFCMPIS
jgi:hypothetical protein